MMESTAAAVRIVADRLRREGLATNDLYVVGDDASFGDVVAACRASRRGEVAPIVVLAAPPEKPERIRAGDVELDLESNRLVVRGVTTILRSKPAAVLATLMRSEGVAVSQASLLREIWGTRGPTAYGVLRVYVHDLRRVLERDRFRSAHIVTVRSERGTAYVFRR